MKTALRKLYDAICRLWDVLDALEPIFYATLAGVVLAAGPLFVIYRFFIRQQLLAAGLCMFVWLGFVATCMRDARRKQFSWASRLLIGAWLILTFSFAVLGP